MIHPSPSQSSRALFGYAQKLEQTLPPPHAKIFRAQLPYLGFAFCDTHLARLMKTGDFRQPNELSPRKRYWYFATLQAYEAVVTAGLDWRQWTAANLPLSEVENWITAKTLRKRATAKGAGKENRAHQKAGR